MKYVLFFILIFFVSGCAPSLITTQWECQQGSRIRITNGWFGEIDTTLPAAINLKSSQKYFVEIITPKSQHLYGTLQVYNKTELTELTNVEINIDNSIINKVLNNQVSQISVRDPSAQENIIVLNLGNKMPSDMRDLYNSRKIKIF